MPVRLPRIAFFLAGAIVVVLIAEVVLGVVVERSATDRLRDRTGAADVEVDIRSRPLTLSLFGRGRLDRVSVMLEDLVSDGVPIANVTFEAVGVDVDRSDALRGGLSVTGIDRAEITVELDVVDPPALPGREFLPCDPAKAIVDDRLILRCSVDHVPPGFVVLGGGPDAPTAEELDQVELLEPLETEVDTDG